MLGASFFGQKKRAAIAGAVAMRPEVLIVDEPLARRARRGRRSIRSVARRALLIGWLHQQPGA
jgi:cobalt/nickel transport system ATP-binding protein